jgi:hypothetical protein
MLHDVLSMDFDDFAMLCRRGNCFGDGVATDARLRGSRAADALAAGRP